MLTASKGYRENVMAKTSQFGKYALAIVWLASVLGGFGALAWYKAQPGPIGAIHKKWPDAVTISPDAFKYSLLIFAHPKCECSDATLEELANVIQESADRLNVRVFFYHPRGTTADWTRTALWEKANRIPGVEVYADEGGIMARFFGAKTSGQTYLYDTRGDLMFAGGITKNRGHIGDNKGRRAIAAVVKTGQPSSDFTNAFGCGLFSEKENFEYRKKIEHVKHREPANEDS